ncbi:MAG: ABC transporter, partial [Clostridia bacterium]
IKAIPGVETAEILRIREEDSIDLNVESEENVDVREAIFEFCREHDYPILMMKTMEMNLEDVFLQITGEKGGKR